MRTVKINALWIAAAVAFHGACWAQSPRAATESQTVGLVPPLDLRVGAISPIDSPDSLTDGGLRTAPSAHQLSRPIVSLGKDYRVGPNDLIEVEIFEAENLKRTVRVNASGTITLPLIGRIPVAGMSSQEIEQEIAARYGEKYLQNPQVSVYVKEFTSERIAIEGAVAHPGIFPLTGRITLLRAMAMAGGFGQIANTSQVMLYRTDENKVRHVSVYDVEKIRAGKAEDPPIQGDDLIVVQRDSTRALLKDSLFRDVIDSINPFSVLAPR